MAQTETMMAQTDTSRWSDDPESPYRSRHPSRYQPFAKLGWVAHTVERQRDVVFKYRVTGANLYSGELFSWRVPDLRGSYDFSQVSTGREIVEQVTLSHGSVTS